MRIYTVLGTPDGTGESYSGIPVVNFIKALTPAFFSGEKMPIKYKIVLAFKMPLSGAINFEKHVANLSIFVAHFGI